MKTCLCLRLRGLALAGSLTLALASPAFAQFYLQGNLVSDIPGRATLQDSNLINPWGMTYNPSGPFWVANQGSKTATVYLVDPATGAVTQLSLVVQIPAAPTGQVFNAGLGFVVSSGGASDPSNFIYSALNGTISGWAVNVPPPAPSTQAIEAAIGVPVPAVYTGLALGTRSAGSFLYAANAAGRIDVFDQAFAQVAVPGNFTDPDLPAGDVPFNIVNINGSLYVTYMGPTGAVNVFDTDGTFVKRFATGGTLQNPWGIAVAPDGFGAFSHAVLIGNFNHSMTSPNGMGHISAFDESGQFLGLLEDTSGKPILIDGLWTLLFGNGHGGGAANVLYFTAGIGSAPGVNLETHGLLGSLATCGGPVISGVSANPSMLWPPNHKFVLITVDYTLADNCAAGPGATLSVASDEGDAGSESILVDAHHVYLESARYGNGRGRTYTITITASDTLGLTSTATATVLVPHNR
jgi:uncharacterized protein (TIGR03118 family)